jgi:hypothetical protein
LRRPEGGDDRSHAALRAGAQQGDHATSEDGAALQLAVRRLGPARPRGFASFSDQRLTLGVTVQVVDPRSGDLVADQGVHCDLLGVVDAAGLRLFTNIAISPSGHHT